mmetsp:Transcript_40174/g.106307  ORF Transcript_40174/g.106307 Transcript_40174/m.106307 type:complete len:321 (-) Transcript_40174:51-1013(-)
MQRLRVAPLVSLWYAASIAAVWTAKLMLRELPCPALLCTVQFMVAFAGSRMMIPASARSIGKSEVRAVVATALAYTTGFLVTNAAIAIAAPSFVETIKSAEPLSTVALASFVLGERERWSTLAALLPLVLGVAMACSGGAAFSAKGMVLAMASNLMFSGRAVLTKSLKRNHPGVPASKSDMCLFYHVSRYGLYLLIPCTLVLEFRTALRWATAGDNGDGSRSVFDLARASTLLLINGTAHAIYNGVSFIVLAKVSIASHAVLNICRRVLVIAVAAVVFATPITALNWVGVSITVLGVILFAQTKGQGVSTRARSKALLPV